MLKKIELYKEPIEILDKCENNGYAGMSYYELSFLCGALKKFKPKKIVEVGVAAGGTTAVILKCMESLDSNCEIFSVDICKQCYIDISKRTGFIVSELLKKESFKKVTHKFMLGGTVASKVEEIGEDIDFVILDTMHSLPGELLDFIVLYPFLGENAVVVFHDVGQSQLGISNVTGAPFEYASLITLIAASGEKYVGEDYSRIARLANIGAIRLDKSCACDIENLFLSLFVNWNYIPDKKSLNEYRRTIEKYYDKQYFKMLEQAIECNIFSMYRRNHLSVRIKNIKDEMSCLVKKATEIYIYGAGEIGRFVEYYVRNLLNIDHITGYIVTNKGGLNSKDKLYELSEIKTTENMLIILGLDEKYHLDVLNNLYRKGFAEYVFPHNGVGFREMMEVIKYENELEINNERYMNTYGYEAVIRKAAMLGE